MRGRRVAPFVWGECMGRFAFLAVLVVAASVVSAHAQTAQDQLRATERTSPSADLGPLGDASIRFTSQRPPSNADDIRFTLTAVSVAGSTGFAPEAFEMVYGEDIGREITLTRVYEIAAEVQGVYRDKDFIFTRVVVPAQEIDGGAVRIDVIEARIEAVVVEEPGGEVGPVRDLVERLLQPVVGAVNPTGAMLERALLNVNDLPGVVRATAVPQQGVSGDRGALDLFVNVEREEFNGALYADNRQTPGIGRGLAGVTVSFNSYSSAADTTTVSLFNSFAYRNDELENNQGQVVKRESALDFDERNTVQVVHQRNFGEDGLRVKATGLYSRTRPGDDLDAIGIEGEQIFFAAALEYPLILRRQFQLRGAISAEVFESTTDVSNGQLRVSDDSLRVVSARLEGLYRDSLGYTLFDAEVRKGLDIFGASESGDQTLSRNDGDGDFTLVKASLERLVVMNEDLSFLGRLAGQYSFDPLLASEEFAIGGLTFGRGFDPSEFTRDHGVGVSGELRYMLPTFTPFEEFSIATEAYGFTEYAAAFDRGSGDEDGQVFSAGAGFRFFLPGQTLLNAELAFPLNNPLIRASSDGDPTIDGGRFFLTFSKQF